MSTRSLVHETAVTARLRMRYLAWPATEPGTVPVVLLHPNRARADVWRPLVEHSRLPNAFIAPDLRGHGETEWPASGYTHADAVADLGAFLDTLKLDRVFLCGAAVNGAVVLRYASEHPERVAGVIASDVGYAIDPGLVRQVQKRILTGIFHPSAAAALAGDHATDHWGPEATALYTEAMFTRTVNGVRWNYHAPGVAAMMEPPDPPLLDVLNVRVPTLLVRGANSKPMSAEALSALAAAIPGAATAEIPDADHILSLDNPSAYAEILDATIRRWSE